MTQPFSFSVGLCQLSARPEAEPHDNITFYGFTRAVSGRYRDERIASSPSPDEFSHSNADIVGQCVRQLSVVGFRQMPVLLWRIIELSRHHDASVFVRSLGAVSWAIVVFPYAAVIYGSLSYTMSISPVTEKLKLSYKHETSESPITNIY